MENQRSGRGGIGRRKGLKISGDGIKTLDNFGNIDASPPAATPLALDVLETLESTRRKNCHEARREREAWALAVVKGMTRSPSAPEFPPEPRPGKATNLEPVHLSGDEDSPGVVYFAYCAGRIKIGYSTHAPNRMNGYVTHAPFPVTLLLTIGACPEDEQDYHEKFAEDRRHNEWFHLSMELRAFLEENIGDDGFTLLFEVEHDFYEAMKGTISYISEIMEELERDPAWQRDLNSSTRTTRRRSTSQTASGI